jgi:hypothetical protein
LGAKIDTLHPDSGAFLMRGEINPPNASPQLVTKPLWVPGGFNIYPAGKAPPPPDPVIVAELPKKDNIYTWLYGGADWEPRDNSRGRRWK